MYNGTYDMRPNKEELIQAYVWKAETVENVSLYRVQIDKIFGIRIEKRVMKYLNDWSLGGNGYHPRTKEITLFFSREFASEEEWKVWAKQFPWKLSEISQRTGKVKKVWR